MILPVVNRLLSSAKIIGADALHLFAKSFIQIKNNDGSKIEPCGSPHIMVSGVE